MPMTKEERAEYDKQYKIDNADKIKQSMKEYNQSPQGKKSRRIVSWKRQGIKCEDWNLIYEWFLSVTNCEKCDILLTKDKLNTSTTKCLDHCHQTGEIRYVLCHSCNCNDRSDNTSGTPNIYKRKNGYRYIKTKNKITHSKWFKTKEEAIKYKEEYERN